MVLLLGTDGEKIQGCPILFPDTAFFEDGKVTEIIKTDKDGFLVLSKFDSKNGISDVRTTFTTIVRERRKEVAPDLLQASLNSAYK